MAPYADDKKSEKKIHHELMEKLKLDEEREKRKLEKESKRRAELDKITKESFVRQASLLVNEKKQTVYPKKTNMKPESNSKPPKSSRNNKPQNYGLESKFNQGKPYEPSTYLSKAKSSGTKEQFHYSGNKFTPGGFRENAWKRNDSKSFQNHSRYSPVSDSMWSDSDEHFPALGAAAPVPMVNVWEERKSKQEAVKSLEPQSAYDEEAMLQQALALSMLEAAEEEEKRKKMEVEYRTQMEALHIPPDVLENSDASDEFVVTRSKLESLDDLDDFQTKKQYQIQNFSRNSASNINQKEKAYSSGGARPKINKVIDRFGGWGLKDEKKGSNSEKLSDFVEEVVCEKSKKKADRCNIMSNYQNDCKSKNVKENSSSMKHPWDISDTKDIKKSTPVPESWDKHEMLYDGKGTFVDEDGNWDCSSSTKKEHVEVPIVSPNKVLDTWLSSDSIDDGNKDKILSEKKGSTTDVQIDNNSIHVSSYNDKPIGEYLNDKNTFISSSAYIPNVTDDYESKNVYSKIHDSLDLSPKISESGKNTWPDAINHEQNELPQNKSNIYTYDISDQSKSDFSPFHESAQIPSLTANDIWSDKSSNNSSYFTSFPDKQNLSSKTDLESKMECKFGNDVESEVFNSLTLSDDTDLPPILPPQPPPTMPAMNEDKAFSNEISDADCNVETPILPPQPAPEVPVPQFPVLNNPLFNPMFAGFSPMLGFGMDPILMRQMLMLSNPFLASQILAMEQHYRSLGMPIDLLSVPTAMPTVSIPGMMGPSLVHNTFANTVNANASSDTSQLQNQFDSNQCTSVSESNVSNSEQNPFEKSSQLPGLDIAPVFNNSSSSLENGTDDPWYKSYLSSGSTSVIPPPKPPSNDVNCDNLMSVSKPSESSLSASSFNNNAIANTYIPDNSVSQFPVSENESHESFSAVEACITKTKVTGWNDSNDDFVDTCKSKTTSWDDGWGDDAMPTKPLRNPSLYEDKKKTVFRQPAKQPQISRYQRNKTYN